VEEPTATFQQKQGPSKKKQQGPGLVVLTFNVLLRLPSSSNNSLHLASLFCSNHDLTNTTSTDIGHHVFLSLYRYRINAAADCCWRESCCPACKGAGLYHCSRCRQDGRFLLDIHGGAACY
jgi:hypothetical protein